MKNWLLAIIFSFLAVLTTEARITAYGLPAQYGLGPDPENWYEVNPHTWEVFTNMDASEMFGVDNPDSNTFFGVEYHSTGVLEGRKVGDSTLVASFNDRRSFFGGDGYLELCYFAPVNIDKYAQQAMFLGGWKYNLTKYVDIDLGGNFIYATKPVIGPGIAGYGGETSRGDFYVGFMTDKIFLRPFAYFDYDITLDAQKWTAGISPIIDLSKLTAINGLYLQSQGTVGYVDANRWSGNQKINGSLWRNSYSYFQAESYMVYEYDSSIRIFAGIGLAIHNDGKNAPNGVAMGPSSMLWGTCGIAYIF